MLELCGASANAGEGSKVPGLARLGCAEECCDMNCRDMESSFENNDVTPSCVQLIAGW